MSYVIVFLWLGTRARCRSFQRRLQNRCRLAAVTTDVITTAFIIEYPRSLACHLIMFCQEKQIKILRKNSDPKVPCPLKLRARH